jgi:CRISPR-associated protein (TIGR03986 family)
MTASHKNPNYKNRVAIAPYNFVPLPEAVLTVNDFDLNLHDTYKAELLTGTLSCTLKTESPLYVRAARTWKEYIQKDKDGKSYTPSDPYYGETKDTLLIPGSSLRGMLRNLVEVVSYSRISPVTRNPLFYRTVDVSSIGKAYGKRMSGGDAGQQGWFTLSKAGYMVKENGDYFIYPAREIFSTQHFRVHEDVALAAGLKNKKGEPLAPMAERNDSGRWRPNKNYHWMRERVWFKPVQPTSHLPESPTYYADVSEIRPYNEGTKPDGANWQKGWFIAGGWVPSTKGGGKKRHWIIGPRLEDKEARIPVGDEDIDLYDTLTGGRTQAVKKDDMSVLPKDENEYIPCFYSSWKDENGKERIAFGHTGMFRLPYLQSPAEMLPNEIKTVVGYDLAEALFGFVDQARSERGAVAGRVFVTDAKLNGDPKKAVMEKEMILSDQALSGPKPTTVQHYLNQIDPDHPENLKHYDSNPNEDTALRGHKFYWHVGDSQDFDKRLSCAPEHRPGDQLNKFKPVKAGQKFTFEIHFENLHPRELGALLWVLDKATGAHRLKLGMGKPYGLGSVEITYDVALTDRVRRYDDLFDDDDGWNVGQKPNFQDDIENAKKEFRKFVINDKRINPTNAQDIDQLPRIREFLVLLSWQNRPSEEKTRYMTLKQFTGQEPVFAGLTRSRRPVLPAASKVLDNQWFAGLPSEAPREKLVDHPGQSERPANLPPRSVTRTPPPVKTTPPTKRQRPPRPEPPKPVEKNTSQLKPGDIISGTVEQNTGAGKEVWLMLEHGERNDRATIPAGTSTIKRYKKGEKVLLEVRALEGNSEDGFLITCHPVDL